MHVNITFDVTCLEPGDQTGSLSLELSKPTSSAFQSASNSSFDLESSDHLRLLADLLAGLPLLELSLLCFASIWPFGLEPELLLPSLSSSSLLAVLFNHLSPPALRVAEDETLFTFPWFISALEQKWGNPERSWLSQQTPQTLLTAPRPRHYLNGPSRNVAFFLCLSRPTQSCLRSRSRTH